MNNEYDNEATLAEMDQLAKEAGDWRDHLPYEKACNYDSDPDIQSLYIGHVTDCQFCQELVATFGSGPRDTAGDHIGFSSGK